MRSLLLCGSLLLTLATDSVFAHGRDLGNLVDTSGAVTSLFAKMSVLGLDEKDEAFRMRELQQQQERQQELQDLKHLVSQNPCAPSRMKSLNLRPCSTPQTSHVYVPERGHRDDKDAKGTFYDWFVLRRADRDRKDNGQKSPSPRSINIIVSDALDTPFGDLQTYLKTNPYGAELLKQWKNVRVLKDSAVQADDAGLLVIPGRMRDREYDAARASQEEDLIRSALNRGQPVLAICAGAWRLWDAVRQLEWDATHQITSSADRKRVPEGSHAVKDHGYSRMMTFSESTGKVVYNVDLHPVSISRVTLLSAALLGKKASESSESYQCDVNSVHWKSVDEEQKPDLLQVSAVSLPVPGGVKVPRLGTITPEKDAVEAFESKYGAPLLGIQWHPEAYNPGDSNDQHLEILRYMMRAGDTYQARRQVFRDLQKKFSSNH